MGATRFNTAVCDAPLTRQVIEKRFPLYSLAMDKQRREMQNLRDLHRNIIFLSSSTKQDATNAFDKRA